jgi:hypothetical protein
MLAIASASRSNLQYRAIPGKTRRGAATDFSCTDSYGNPREPAPSRQFCGITIAKSTQGAEPALAKFYTEHSYVFFVPHCREQGRSPGPYIQDLVPRTAPWARGRRMIELQDEEVADVIAALGLRPVPCRRTEILSLRTGSARQSPSEGTTVSATGSKRLQPLTDSRSEQGKPREG